LSDLKAERSAERREIEISSIATAGDEEPVIPEIAAVIAAAATAFVGAKPGTGSAKSAHAAPDTTSAWSQQGRVVVQTSHNFRSRG
jgi:Flp pilus assembly CpaE family ATPase